jgi:hypothetical protein
MYGFVVDVADRALEFLILQQSDYTTIVRYMPQATQAEQAKILDVLRKTEIV